MSLRDKVNKFRINRPMAKKLRCGKCSNIIGELEGDYIKIPCPGCKNVNLIKIRRG